MNYFIQSIALAWVHWKAGANMGVQMQEVYQERETTEGKESLQTAMQCWNPWKRKEEDWVGRAFVHTSNKVLVKPMASPWAKDAFGKITTSI